MAMKISYFIQLEFQFLESNYENMFVVKSRWGNLWEQLIVWSDLDEKFDPYFLIIEDP